MRRASRVLALVFIAFATRASDAQAIRHARYVPDAFRPAEGMSMAPQVSDGPRNPYTFHKRLALWSLAATYATTVMTAAAMDDKDIGTTAIPVAGPWITMARIEGSSTQTYHDGGKPLLAAAGLAQTGFLLYSLVAWHHEQSYSSRVTLLPLPSRRGISLAVAF